MAIEIIDILKQKNSNEFALIDCNDLLGGFYQVDTIGLRNAIPIVRRRENMMCYVKEDGTVYQLQNGTNNSNWQKCFIKIEEFEEVKVSLLMLSDTVNELQERILALENATSRIRAICGDFVSGEAVVGQNLTDEELNTGSYQIERYIAPNITSALSDNFKKKLKKVDEEEVELKVGETDGI